MADTNITTPAAPTPEDTNTNTYDTNTDYIAVIEEMKANTVPKSDFEKLQEEKKRLLETLVKGGQATPQTAPKKPDISKLRQELYGGDSNLSNLEYWDKTLTLRDAIIAEGQPDPFLPYGKKIAPTAEDAAKANNVAKVIRECIKYAEGDSRVFTNELNRLIVDNVPNVRRRR